MCMPMVVCMCICVCMYVCMNSVIYSFTIYICYPFIPHSIDFITFFNVFSFGLFKLNTIRSEECSIEYCYGDIVLNLNGCSRFTICT